MQSKHMTFYITIIEKTSQKNQCVLSSQNDHLTTTVWSDPISFKNFSPTYWTYLLRF